MQVLNVGHKTSFPVPSRLMAGADSSITTENNAIGKAVVDDENRNYISKLESESQHVCLIIYGGIPINFQRRPQRNITCFLLYSNCYKKKVS